MALRWLGSMLAKSRWRCPECDSDNVQISLPTWYRETQDYDLIFEETDKGADPMWWVCDDCEASGTGEQPIDNNEVERTK